MSDNKYEDPTLDEIMAGNATPADVIEEDEILEEVDPPPKKGKSLKTKILMGLGMAMLAMAIVVYQNAPQKQAAPEQQAAPAPQEPVVPVQPAPSPTADPLGMAPAPDTSVATTPNSTDPFAQTGQPTASGASTVASTPAAAPVAAPVQEQPLAEAKMPEREPVKQEPVKVEKAKPVEPVEDYTPVEPTVVKKKHKRVTHRTSESKIKTVKSAESKTDFYIPNHASSSVILPSHAIEVAPPVNVLPTSSTPAAAEQPLGWTPLN